MRRVAWFLIAFSAIFGAKAQDAPDRCRDILIYAAHNINQSFHTSSMASDIKSALCDTSSNSSGSSRSGGGGLVVFGYFGVNGHASNQQVQQMQHQMCTSNQNALSNQQLDQVLSNVVDPDSVSAWNQCVQNQGKGLIGSIERDDSVVVLRLRWVAGFDVDRAVITSVQVDGATCDAIWPKGTSVSSVSLLTQCQGSPAHPVSVTIQTDKDSIRLKSPIVPAAVVQPAPAPPKSLKERCFAGEITACREAAQEQTAACGGPGGSRLCLQKSICFQDVEVSLSTEARFCRVDPSSGECSQAKTMREQSIATCEGHPPSLPPLPFRAPALP